MAKYGKRKYGNFRYGERDDCRCYLYETVLNAIRIAYCTGVLDAHRVEVEGDA